MSEDGSKIPAQNPPAKPSKPIQTVDLSDDYEPVNSNIPARPSLNIDTVTKVDESEK